MMADCLQQRVGSGEERPTNRVADRAILALATKDTHKFAVQLGIALEQYKQDALERLMLRDWIRLIDVSTLGPEFKPGSLWRIFRVMPEALEWLDSPEGREP